MSLALLGAGPKHSHRCRKGCTVRLKQNNDEEWDCTDQTMTEFCIGGLCVEWPSPNSDRDDSKKDKPRTQCFWQALSLGKWYLIAMCLVQYNHGNEGFEKKLGAAWLLL